MIRILKANCKFFYLLLKILGYAEILIKAKTAPIRVGDILPVKKLFKTAMIMQPIVITANPKCERIYTKKDTTAAARYLEASKILTLISVT